jgi:membrane-bound metal-dependent hydrolase YbcI (DUF457 family)
MTMMGTRHAMTGVLGATSAAAYLDLSPPYLLLAASVLPGAALLPDLDHERSTASGTFGPLTRLFSLVLRHRRETHSVPGVLALGVLLEACVRYRHEVPAQVVLIVVLVLVWSSVLRVFGINRKIKGWLDDLAPVPIAIFLVVYSGVDLQPVPYAVMAGCLIHIAGDMITKQGCPLLWPFSKVRYRVAKFRAGGWWERWPITVLIVAGIVWTTGVWLTSILGPLVDPAWSSGGP